MSSWQHLRRLRPNHTLCGKMRWLLLAWAAAALASPLQSPLLAPLAFQARIANLTNGDIAQFDLDVLSRSGNHAEVLFRSLADVPAGLDIVRLHELLHPPTPTPTSLDLHASYHTLESLENTMRAWAADFPQYVSLSQIGTSAEGRPLTALTLSKSDQKTPSPHQKLRFLITAGSHAREWIGPSSALFFMDQLLFAATLPPNIIEPQYQRALDNFEFVFVPVSNPDGYLYSWTTDRRAFV
jgi:murein tripeptide amidase MpaA